MANVLSILPVLEAQNPWWGNAAFAAGRNHARQRELLQRLLKKILDPEHRRATLLLGPRQVGKSTLLHQLVIALTDRGWPPQNITYFDFSDDRARGQDSLGIVTTIAEHIPLGTKSDVPRVLLLDEIHHAENWPAWMKRAVDDDRRLHESKLRIVATDSAATLLRDGTIESGQGRWDEERIYGLSFGEYLHLLSREGEHIEGVFQRRSVELRRYLSKGGFPEHSEKDPSDELRRIMREDVAERAIRRDILRPGLAHSTGERLDIDRIRRLFVYLAQDSGAILTITDRALELDAHRASVAQWIELLRDACLIHRVEPFHPSAKQGRTKPSTRLASKPKIYVAEHGLISAFAVSAEPYEEPAIRGRIFEAVVLRHLLDLVPSREDVFYYRREGGAEIDFVFRHGGRLIAVEVTSGTAPDRRTLEPLLKGAEEIGADRVFLIHGGTQARVDERGTALPIHSFLMNSRQLIEEESR